MEWRLHVHELTPLSPVRPMAIATINPATGERVREFSPLAPREIEDRLAIAHRTARAWRTSPLEERMGVLRRAAELLEERKAEYGRDRKQQREGQPDSNPPRAEVGPSLGSGVVHRDSTPLVD